MKTFIPICFFLITAGTSSAQKIFNTGCGKKEFAVTRFYGGDTIVVHCDTVFMINAATYKLCTNVFRSAKTTSADLKQLTLFYEESRVLYEKRIQEQSVEYGQLKNRFDNLLINSQQVLQTTSANLTKIDASLTSVDRHLAKAEATTKEAKELIRNEVRQSWKQKLRWGAGGLLFGCVLTSAIILSTDE